MMPISAVFGFDRGVPIDRYYIENFLAREAASIHGRVLEIGDNSYTKKFGGSRVATSDVLHIVDGNPQATIVGDLAAADHIPSDLFDCVILTQTLQCIYDVRAAIRTLYRIVKPGGVVLATFPGITKISHRDWGYTWYWNFTALSARRLFEEAFPADAVNVETHGNVLAAISLLHGLATEELRRDELEHHDPDYEVLLTAKAVKPGLSNTEVRETNTRQRGVSAARSFLRTAGTLVALPSNYSTTVGSMVDKCDSGAFRPASGGSTQLLKSNTASTANPGVIGCRAARKAGGCHI